MPIFIDVPNLVVPADNDWTLIPDVPVQFPLDELADYFAVEGALVVDDKVSSAAAWRAVGALASSTSATAPTIVDVNGVSMFTTVRASSQSLIRPGSSFGPYWQDPAGDEFTFVFPVQALLADGSILGFINAFGFRLRGYHSGSSWKLNIQRAYSGGTNTFEVVTDLANVCIIAMSYNTATNTLKLYKNGTLIASDTTVNWGTT
jgi:hypothetical protein